MIIRRRTYDNLRARVSAYQAQVNAHHQRIDTDRVRQSVAIVRGVRLSTRLDRMVRATARYRAAIDAGAQWQERRADKPKPVAL